MNYLENREEMLSVLLSALESFSDGEATCTHILFYDCFPDESAAADFDEFVLMDVNRDIFNEAEKHGLYLDMTKHYNRVEGLPYSLDYTVYHNKVEWYRSVDELLIVFQEIIQKSLSGSYYYASIDEKPTQKHVSIYRNGEKQRVAFIKPKKNTHSVDITLFPEMIASLRMLTSLPEDREIKKNRTYRWRQISGLTEGKLCEVCRLIAKL